MCIAWQILTVLMLWLFLPSIMFISPCKKYVRDVDVHRCKCKSFQEMQGCMVWNGTEGIICDVRAAFKVFHPGVKRTLPMAWLNTVCSDYNVSFRRRQLGKSSLWVCVYMSLCDDDCCALNPTASCFCVCMRHRWRSTCSRRAPQNWCNL